MSEDLNTSIESLEEFAQQLTEADTKSVDEAVEISEEVVADEVEEKTDEVEEVEVKEGDMGVSADVPDDGAVTSAVGAAAEMLFDTEEEAANVAEVLKCEGTHSQEDGKFMPCGSHEDLIAALEVVTEAEEAPEADDAEKAADSAIEEKAAVAEAEVDAPELEVSLTEVEAEKSAELEVELEEKATDELLAMMEVEVKADDLLDMIDAADSAAVEADAGSTMCACEHKTVEEVCDACVGGCVADDNVAGLATVEAAAMKSAGGDAEVINSGYSPKDDTYVVDVKAADGIIREYFYNGAGEEKGYLVVEASEEEASASITSEQAADIATEYKSGSVVSVESGVILGNDAYVIEVDAVEGKSFDVFVSLSGEVLGHDEYNLVEAKSELGAEDLLEIKALEAELEIKRMYSREMRMELAKSGEAMKDGSFPIVDEADLKNAIQAYGRADDMVAAKAHIVERAEALDLATLIPADWAEEAEEAVPEAPEAAPAAPEAPAEEEKGVVSIEARTESTGEGPTFGGALVSADAVDASDDSDLLAEFSRFMLEI